jgi:hypothetical protein
MVALVASEEEDGRLDPTAGLVLPCDDPPQGPTDTGSCS